MDYLVLIIRHNNFFYLKNSESHHSFMQIPISVLSANGIKEAVRKKLNSKAQGVGLVSVRLFQSPLNGQKSVCCHVIVEWEGDSEVAKDWKWSSGQTVEQILRNHPNRFCPDDAVALENIFKNRISCLSLIDMQQYDVCEAGNSADLKSFDDQQRLILESAKFSSEDLEMLHKVFTEYAWPKRAICIESLGRLFSDFLVKDIRIDHYYRALATSGELKYKDFAVGLAAMDPITDHGIKCGKARCGYIFRFYTEGEVMKESNYREIIHDLLKHKGKSLTQTETEIEVTKYFSVFGNPKNPIMITEPTFTDKVSQMKLRGTSTLFRDDSGLMNRLRKKYIQKETDDQVLPDYPSRIMNIETIESSSQTSSDDDFQLKKVSVDFTSTAIETIEVGEAFGEYSLGLQDEDVRNAKDVLRGIQFFVSSGMSWQKTNKLSFADSVMRLCLAVKDVLKEEPKVVEVAGACYVVGAINGDLGQLLKLHTVLWPLGIESTPISTCFLADYVGSKEGFGLEVLLYLFAIKLTSAHKKNLWMLRGCQETAHGLFKVGLRKRCNDVFGDNDGVFCAIQECLDSLPFLAVINEKIACVHRGFPVAEFSSKSIFEHLRKLAKSVPNPDRFELLSRILWDRQIGLNEWSEATVDYCTTVSPNDLRSFLYQNHFAALITCHPVTENLEPSLICLPPLTDNKRIYHVAVVEKAKIALLELKAEAEIF